MLKDAVSIPGISMTYVLNKVLDMGADLYLPGQPCSHNCQNECVKLSCKACKQIKIDCTLCAKDKPYELLKTGMIVGPSIVFCRYAEAEMAKIRSHKYENAKTCKSVVGFDANSLYLYCSGQDMPCGKEEYVEIEKPNDPKLIDKLCKDILEDKLFGFLQADILVPDNLKEKFIEFSPLFVVDIVPENMIPKHMKDYQKNTGRKTLQSSRKLLGVTKAENILLYMPVLKWYLNHGLKVTGIYEYLKYKPSRPFGWFLEEFSMPDELRIVIQL